MNEPHATDQCDESCSGCAKCYTLHGQWVCDWNCPHTSDNREVELSMYEADEAKFDVIYTVNNQRHRTMKEYTTYQEAYEAALSFRAAKFNAWVEEI